MNRTDLAAAEAERLTASLNTELLSPVTLRAAISQLDPGERHTLRQLLRRAQVARERRRRTEAAGPEGA